MRIRVDPVEYGAQSRMTIRMIELYKRCKAFQGENLFNRVDPVEYRFGSRTAGGMNDSY
jgi:hypothetical protein